MSVEFEFLFSPEAVMGQRLMSSGNAASLLPARTLASMPCVLYHSMCLPCYPALALPSRVDYNRINIKTTAILKSLEKGRPKLTVIR